LERTALRFGNPTEVTNQLQETVSVGDSIMQFWEGRPEESTLRGALRLAWVFEVFVLVICGAVVFVIHSRMVNHSLPQPGLPAPDT
jgi:hypothetical protein